MWGAWQWDRSGRIAGWRAEVGGLPVPRRGSWRSHCSVTHASAFLPNRRAPTSSFLQIGSGYGNWAQGSTVLTSLLYVSELRSDALQFDPQSGSPSWRGRVVRNPVISVATSPSSADKYVWVSQVRIVRKGYAPPHEPPSGNPPTAGPCGHLNNAPER